MGRSFPTESSIRLAGINWGLGRCGSYVVALRFGADVLAPRRFILPKSLRRYVLATGRFPIKIHAVGTADSGPIGVG